MTKHYAVQIPVETADEPGLPVCEFNEMAARLGRYHEMGIEQIISEKKQGETIFPSIEDGLPVFDTGLKTTGINQRRVTEDESDAGKNLLQKVQPVSGSRT